MIISDTIHPTSIVSSKSVIGKNVSIGPFSIIEDNVEIGDNTKIHSSVLIKKDTIIRSNCDIYNGAVLGEKPQDLKYNEEVTNVEIGSNTIIREFCTIHRGTSVRGKTVVGSNCLLMAYVHIAHDCIVKDNVIIANNVQVGGHVDIEDYCNIGGSSLVHQFCKVGCYSFLGAGFKLVQDLPPYIKASGNPAKFAGVNSIGLSRNGFDEDTISTIKKIYRMIYRSDHNTSQAIQKIEENFPKGDKVVENILTFIESSDRGII